MSSDEFRLLFWSKNFTLWEDEFQLDVHIHQIKDTV